MVFTTIAVKAKIVIQEKVVNDAIGFSLIFQNGYILHLFTSFDKSARMIPYSGMQIPSLPISRNVKNSSTPMNKVNKPARK